MANGRALPTALLFDDLLGRAWARAQRNVNAATALAAPVVNVTTMARSDGNYDLLPFKASAVRFQPDKLLRDYDVGVAQQLRELQSAWSNEMQQVMQTVAPVGAAFGQAVSWLRQAAEGADVLGYLGQGHRVAQIEVMQERMLQSAGNPRALPMPAGAMSAVLAVTTKLAGLALDRAGAQMDADRERERIALRIEAAELLMRLRNAAVDASIDYVNNRMSAMLDVYGSSNDYRTQLEMEAAAKRASMQGAVTALEQHEASLKSVHAASMDGSRRVGEINDRTIERTMMLVDSYVKRMRRHASRAASALNSAGVSVNSSASESNTVSAEQ